MSCCRAGCAIAAVIAIVLVSACGKRDSAPPASWEPDRSCVSSSECRPAPSCCVGPCTSYVINERDVSKLQQRVDAECTPERRARCPQAGSCEAHIYACVRGRCALVTEGSPDWPKDAALAD